jgi:hypothetical protein
MITKVHRRMWRWWRIRELSHRDAAKMFRLLLYGDQYGDDRVHDRRSLLRLLARRALATATDEDRGTWVRFERATRPGHRVGSVTGRIVYFSTVPVDPELADDVESAFTDKEQN